MPTLVLVAFLAFAVTWPASAQDREGGAAFTGSAARTSGLPPSSDTLRVLFLGNSYTYYNNLPELVEAMAASLDGPRIRAGAHTHGGITLRGHLADGHLPEILGDGAGADGPRWDRVVLQEQSLLGTEIVDPATGRLGEPLAFQSSARVLAGMARAAGSEPVLYMTWARERYPGQTTDLAAAYARVGTRMGAPVAPVGIAWARARVERPDLELFQPDGSHPSPAGSYLAACVLYATLTGRSPEGAPAVVRGGTWDGPGFWAKVRHLLPLGETIPLVSLAGEDARYLQRLAWEVARAEGGWADPP